jgi:hypothetical protein
MQGLLPPHHLWDLMLGVDWRWQIVITFVPVAWEIVSAIVFVDLKTTAVLKPYFS